MKRKNCRTFTKQLKKDTVNGINNSYNQCFQYLSNAGNTILSNTSIVYCHTIDYTLNLCVLS